MHVLTQKTETTLAIIEVMKLYSALKSNDMDNAKPLFKVTEYLYAELFYRGACSTFPGELSYFIRAYQMEMISCKEYINDVFLSNPFSDFSTNSFLKWLNDCSLGLNDSEDVDFCLAYPQTVGFIRLHLETHPAKPFGDCLGYHDFYLPKIFSRFIASRNALKEIDTRIAIALTKEGRINGYLEELKAKVESFVESDSSERYGVSFLEPKALEF